MLIRISASYCLVTSALLVMTCSGTVVTDSNNNNNNNNSILTTAYIKLQMEDLDAPATCQALRELDFCKTHQVGNRTLTHSGACFPNLIGHRNEHQTGDALRRYQVLLDSPGRCGQSLRAFICPLYLPACTVTGVLEAPLPPCQSVCRAAREGCSKALLRRGAGKWPREWMCDLLPLSADIRSRGPCLTPQKKKS